MRTQRVTPWRACGFARRRNSACLISVYSSAKNLFAERFFRVPASWSFILIRRMQHTALSKLHWLLLAVVLTVVVPAGMAQVQTDIASSSLPDAPTPQQNAPPATSATTPPPISTSASQTDAQDEAKKKQQSEADATVKRQQNQQRILGVMPMFNVGNGAGLPPLRPKEKFKLFWKSSTDPFIFGLDAIIAGIGQAENSNAGTKVVQNPNGTTRLGRWG